MQSFAIAVLGAGNMGTAVAQILANRGRRVWLWDYNADTVAAIKRTGANEQFLPGVKLSKLIVAEASMQKAVEKAELVVVACASPYVRQTARHLAHCLDMRRPSLRRHGGSASRYPIIAHVAKGLEAKTNLTMHEVMQFELLSALRRRVVSISGPSIAKELAAGVPTAVVAASQDKKAAELVRDVFEYTEALPRSRPRQGLPTLRVATSSDWKGVGLCGALKNVYAIALGMCDGMRLTMNAKAFLFAVAVREMEQIVTALGGRASTVHGLAGIGDLMVTGLGQGHNRALGERICKEGHCKFVWKKNAQTHEGVAATKVFYELAHRHKLDVPLINTVHRVLYRGADSCKAIQDFFATFKFL